jgi:hypothetical protein
MGLVLRRRSHLHRSLDRGYGFRPQTGPSMEAGSRHRGKSGRGLRGLPRVRREVESVMVDTLHTRVLTRLPSPRCGGSPLYLPLQRA